MSVKLVALNNFYSKVLKDLGIVHNDKDGFLSVTTSAGGDSESPIDKIPVLVDGKRLALPVQSTLDMDDVDEINVFHPIREQRTTGVSPVLRDMRVWVHLRVTDTAKAICEALAELSADKKGQSKGMPKIAREAFKELSNADATFSQLMVRIMKEVADIPVEKRMINMFLRNGGTEKVPNGIRTSVVSYPILDDAHNGDLEKFFGVTMKRKSRIKDKDMLVALIEFVLGDADEFTTASTNGRSPYFHALLSTFYKMAKHQNEIIDAFKKQLPELQVLRYNLDWSEEMDDFENFSDKVFSAAPALPGNSGRTGNKEEDDLDILGDIVEDKEEVKRDERRSRRVTDEVEESPRTRRVAEKTEDDRRTRRVGEEVREVEEDQDDRRTRRINPSRDTGRKTGGDRWKQAARGERRRWDDDSGRRWDNRRNRGGWKL